MKCIIYGALILSNFVIVYFFSHTLYPSCEFALEPPYIDALTQLHPVANLERRCKPAYINFAFCLSKELYFVNNLLLPKFLRIKSR